MPYDLNAVREIVSWLMSHGAPAPKLVTLHATYPGGVGWDWDTLEFANAKDPGKPYILSIPTLMGNADLSLSAAVALNDMQKLGIAKGDPNVRILYPLPGTAPEPAKPQPVDDVVGIERADQPGAFDVLDPDVYKSCKRRGVPYLGPGNRKFKAEVRGTGFAALSLWVEVASS